MTADPIEPIERSCSAKRTLALMTVFNLGLCGLGCNTSTASNDAPVRAAMKVLGLQYGRYLAEHDGRPPADENAMNEFLTLRLDELKVYNVTSADDLLRNGRDEKPLGIVTGRKLHLPEHAESTLAAFESEGVGGVRLVCCTRGGIYEMKAEDFQALWQNNK